MACFTLEREIGAPIERVFDASCDFRRAPEHIERIVHTEVLTDGPTRLGTRFRETRAMFGKEHTEEMEVVAFAPNQSYALGCESHGCRYHTELRFEPTGGERAGTKLSMTFQAEPLTLAAKVMSVLMRPMLKSCMKEMNHDLDDLKRVLEAPQAVG
ncbi:MAG: SRPBCC family protein [Planctomycetota bacterium]